MKKTVSIARIMYNTMDYLMENSKAFIAVIVKRIIPKGNIRTTLLARNLFLTNP